MHFLFAVSGFSGASRLTPGGSDSNGDSFCSTEGEYGVGDGSLVGVAVGGDMGAEGDEPQDGQERDDIGGPDGQARRGAPPPSLRWHSSWRCRRGAGPRPGGAADGQSRPPWP